jgi:SOS-response transcriptional repressor LexA
MYSLSFMQDMIPVVSFLSIGETKNHVDNSDTSGIILNMKDTTDIKKERPMWSRRIEQRMIELDLKKQDVASALGVHRTLVGKYIQGFKTPPHSKWSKLAEILQTLPAWLEFGVGPKLMEENNIDIPQMDNIESKNVGFDNRLKLFNLFKIPVLDWVQAREGINAVNMFANNCKNFIYYDKKLSQNSFGLIVNGNAMVPNMPGVRGFFPGERVIIEPNTTPLNGDCVIADAHHLETPILRQYNKEAGVESLVALDSRVKTIELTDDWKILGVVVGYMGGK